MLVPHNKELTFVLNTRCEKAIRAVVPDPDMAEAITERLSNHAFYMRKKDVFLNALRGGYIRNNIKEFTTRYLDTMTYDQKFVLMHKAGHRTGRNIVYNPNEVAHINEVMLSLIMGEVDEALEIAKGIVTAL